MATIVQKYGGTSVGSIERIQSVAARVIDTVKAGNSVVVVVSAMGKTTDGLVALAREISDQPSRREMDMLLSTGEQVSIALLSMALQAAGQPAISLTGAQIGIVTEASHTRARILSIDPDRLRRHLDEGKVVVAAGFQGISNADDLEITTLGRGGSDTSAVALAAALRADACEIYTDVPGVLTTDPRLVPEAQIMAEISCDEMLELASLGAKVLHPRAVEIARNYGVPLIVKSSWTDDPGTRVVSQLVGDRPLENLEIARPVDAIRYNTNQAQIGLLRVPDRPGIAAKLFGELAKQAVDVDLIIQSIHEGNTNDIAFTVTEQEADRAEAMAGAIAPTLRTEPTRPMETEGAEAELVVDRHVAEVSIYGAGMIGRPGVAAQMFKTLADAGINIETISTSEVQVGCIIAPGDNAADRDLEALCQRAVAALRHTFELDTDQFLPEVLPIEQPASPDEPPVRGVALDRNQSQIAVRNVPDRPGMAAKIFELLADKSISVDTIVQSQRRIVVNGSPTRHIAFTTAATEAEAARAVLLAAGQEFGWGEVVVNAQVAKVSAVGTGMINRPGVAAQMFNALAAKGINLLMITTSAIKISCVVEQDQGVEALKAVHEAFDLSGEYQASNVHGLTPAK